MSETTAPPEEDKEWLDDDNNKIMLGVGIFAIVLCLCCSSSISAYFATKGSGSGGDVSTGPPRPRFKYSPYSR
jgi:hypothetical protein